MRSLVPTVSASLLFLFAAPGCDGCGDPEVTSDGEDVGPSSSSTESGSSSGTGGDDTSSPSVSVSGSSSTGEPDPCADVDCAPGSSCVDGTCEPLSCADADCSATEECVEVEGGGHVCDD